MRAVMQKVLKASVVVENEVVSSIGKGLCVFIGISKLDTSKEMKYMVKKILELRLFEDRCGRRWSKSVKEMDYEILCVSQFTLDVTFKGRKPDFHNAMKSDLSRSFYNIFLEALSTDYNPDKIKDGRFGAYMKVNIENDGPVTIPLECIPSLNDGPVTIPLECIPVFTKPVLYSYFPCSASWRVRIVLAMKGIQYDYKAVHLTMDGSEQNLNDCKDINPMCQLPTLIIDGMTLSQSLPIIEYLEDVQPEPPVFPKDIKTRAKARMLAEIINSGMQPLLNLSLLKTMGDNKMEWAKNTITNGFVAIEKHVQHTAGTYCLGDDITVADIFLYPQCYHAKRFGVNMEEFPVICRVEEKLRNLPAFVAADCRNQPDTPDEMKV